ncbi:hypothetical protein PMAYCL1PPCAC_31731 [Pristionchus mayeri]|uniref:Exocyst complex component n=1 Tax=Pristionchus mayeri TaxID=1317129 RepID=A0AAN5DDL2_9BILA|nr:hypothetical protein PMAYCL1PPCAC_31731 [Pristionchus mayeri]
MAPDNSSHLDTTSSSTTTKETTGNSDTTSTSDETLPEISPEITPEIFGLEATGTGIIGLALRAMNGDVGKFSRGIEHRIYKYDKQFEKMCSRHYQGCIDSMKHLKQLKRKYTVIKGIATEIDEDIQMESKKIADKTTEIIQCRKQMRNAMVAIDHISACLPVLENYAKLHELMAQSKYYEALQMIDELEHAHLKFIEQYKLVKDLAKNMDSMRKEIEKKAYSEFNYFLEAIKTAACRIGRQARDNDEQQLAHGIDFAPIHHCSQIFNALRKKEEFEEYYRGQREQQCQMVCKSMTKVTTQVNEYTGWLNQMIGFFVIEDHIHQTMPSLVTAQHREHLWTKASAAVCDVLNSHFGVFSDVEMMISMKKVVLLFALTMERYGYDITRLYLLLKQFTDQCAELLMSAYEVQFVRDLESDNYTPISVGNEEEFRAIVRQFPFYERSIEKEEYPRKFPFSRFVIAVYTQVKNYLVNCLKFMENLQMSHSDMEDAMRKFANVLLVRWSEHLKQNIHSNRSLIQLVQITVNMDYLETSCESLAPFITTIVNGEETPAHSMGQLVALSAMAFRDASTEAEQKIEESLRKKVDLFLDNMAYDWELSSSDGLASDYIMDLMSFLNATFLSFTNLPNALAKHVCIQMCKYVADSLLSILISPSFRLVSWGALDQFSLDVMQCEMFTAQCPVPGLDNQTLPVTFATLRQLLDLVVHDDWPTFCAEHRKERKTYDRVKINDVVVVLVKKMEWEKKASGGVFSIRGNDRKKLHESVLRQLRVLAAEK